MSEPTVKFTAHSSFQAPHASVLQCGLGFDEANRDYELPVSDFEWLKTYRGVVITKSETTTLSELKASAIKTPAAETEEAPLKSIRPSRAPKAEQ